MMITAICEFGDYENTFFFSFCKAEKTNDILIGYIQYISMCGSVMQN